MDRMFDTYGELLEEAQAWLVGPPPPPARRLGLRPPPGGPGQGPRRPARAAAGRLAVQRGHLRHRPVLRDAAGADARPTRCPRPGVYADMMLEELRKVIPSFLQRVDRADRGGAWADYLADHPERTRPGGGRAVPRPGRGPDGDPPADRRAGPRSTCSTSTPTARTRSSPPSAARARPVPSPRCSPGAAARAPRRSGRSCRPTWGSGSTAATVRAGRSSAPTTASTWSPTTAPSATCSATGS